MSKRTKILASMTILIVVGFYFFYNHYLIGITKRIEKAEQYLIDHPIEILDITETANYLKDIYKYDKQSIKYMINDRLRSVYKVEFRSEETSLFSHVYTEPKEGEIIPYEEYVCDRYYLIDRNKNYINLYITVAPSGRFDYFDDKNILITDHINNIIDEDGSKPDLVTYDYQDEPVIKQKAYINHFFSNTYKIYEQYYYSWYPPITLYHNLLPELHSTSSPSVVYRIYVYSDCFIIEITISDRSDRGLSKYQNELFEILSCIEFAS